MFAPSALRAAMPYVRFTRHLRRYFPDLTEQEVAAATVRDLVSALERRYPGLADFLVDDQGALRKHVNVFVGDAPITDRTTLSDRIPEDGEVFILQALSGG